jgi:hypothetical protein
VLTFFESGICDLPQQLGVSAQVTHMPPVHIIRTYIKMLGIQRLQARKL